MTALLAAPAGPSLMQIALLSLLLLVVLGLVWRSWRATVPPRAEAVRESAAERAAQERLRVDLERLAGELEQLSRRLGREVEDHVARLRTAIAEADARVAALRPAPAKPPEPAPFAEPSRPAEEGPRDAAARRIYELADQGATLQEIARQLGRPAGEVELILNLRPRG